MKQGIPLTDEVCLIHALYFKWYTCIFCTNTHKPSLAIEWDKKDFHQFLIPCHKHYSLNQNIDNYNFKNNKFSLTSIGSNQSCDVIILLMWKKLDHTHQKVYPPLPLRNFFIIRSFTHPPSMKKIDHSQQKCERWTTIIDITWKAIVPTQQRKFLFAGLLRRELGVSFLYYRYCLTVSKSCETVVITIKTFLMWKSPVTFLFNIHNGYAAFWLTVFLIGWGRLWGEQGMGQGGLYFE
jgi:hypothetical protein